jgi:hypothetical protein
MSEIFQRNIINLYGDPGKHWLLTLPNLTQSIAKTYQLTQLSPVESMSFHYVMSGLQHDQPVIVKLGYDKHALAQEAACLQAFSQHGAVELLEHAPITIVLLHKLCQHPNFIQPKSIIKNISKKNRDYAIKRKHSHPPSFLTA